VELGQVAEGLTRTTAPVRRHLKHCERCRLFRTELKRTNRALAAIYPIGPLIVIKKLFLTKLGSGAGRRAASRAVERAPALAPPGSPGQQAPPARQGAAGAQRCSEHRRQRGAGKRRRHRRGCRERARQQVAPSPAGLGRSRLQGSSPGSPPVTIVTAGAVEVKKVTQRDRTKAATAAVTAARSLRTDMTTGGPLAAEPPVLEPP
jgi:hypothetical protein